MSRRGWFRLVPVWLLMVCGFGLENGGLRAQDAKTVGSVRGTVQLADTRSPAAGVFVFLVEGARQLEPAPTGDYVVRDEDQPSRGEFHGTADAAGRVTIAAVRPGVYYVVARVPGYISPEEYIAPWALAPPTAGAAAVLPQFVQRVTVEAGKESRFELRLERGGAIEGEVRYAGGGPAYRAGSEAEGVAVNLLVRKPDGSFGHGMAGAAHTDAKGHYRVEGLPPATYVVEIAMLGKMVPTSRGLEATGGLLMFAGSTERISRAEVAELRGRETRTVDVILPSAGMRRVSGRVLTPEGKPLERGQVRLVPKGETDEFYGIPLAGRGVPLQTDGVFSVEDVLPDTYVVRFDDQPRIEVAGLTADGKGLRMHRSDPAYAPLSVEVTVGGTDPPPLELRLAPYAGAAR